MGIEPTGDNPCRPLGFEDREGHQHPIRSHGDFVYACRGLVLQVSKYKGLVSADQEGEKMVVNKKRQKVGYCKQAHLPFVATVC
ncbi:hypothetical protein D2Q93_02390 [Alicyclobacillaceae bacterium I2511]|nr:hypothetical protein D2Q93_02390 [Alicyclobacillaceae bacterium I2511]